MKTISSNLKVSGIYCIINIVNNKRYVGSSINIKQRLFTHRSELRHNKHENPYLQNAWNKHGENNFDYYVVEICDPSVLLEREQFYIDSMNPEYNINLITIKPPISKESRLKQSETRKRLFKEGKLNIGYHHRPVYVYDLDGNYIAEFESIIEASRQLFGKYTGAIGHACRGEQNPNHRVYDKRFYFEKYDKAPDIKCRKKIEPSKIFCFDSEDEHLEFLGWEAAAKYFNCSAGTFSQYLRKKLKFKRKYMITIKLPCK